jgi:hypothetical protein
VNHEGLEEHKGMPEEVLCDLCALCGEFLRRLRDREDFKKLMEQLENASAEKSEEGKTSAEEKKP